jgi:HK97 family phage major capsid protein
MYAQWCGNRGSGVWVVNRDTFPQLAKLSIDSGTAGSPVGLIQQNIAGEPYTRMLGMPILEMEQAQTLGAKGDIYLIDTSQYLLIDKALRGASSIHLKFDYNETAFRWVYRVDGQPKQDSSYTAFKGANSLSPFVTLEARA